MQFDNYKMASEDVIKARQEGIGEFLLFDYTTNSEYYIFNNTIIVKYYDEPEKWYRQPIYREVPVEDFRKILEGFKSVGQELEYIEKVEKIINNIEETNQMKM